MGDVRTGADARLDRVLGVRQLGANIVNYVIGSGIFVLPAVVAAQLGPAALTAYLAAAVAVALVALCFAECGSRVSESGGTYAYVETAFGPLAGALAGAFAYLSYVVAGAAVANIFVGSVAALWEPLGTPAARVAIILLLFVGVGWLNVRGVAFGARLVVFTTVGKLAPLVLLVIAGLFHVEPANFAGFHWPGAAELSAATLLLVFAFTGAEGALTPSGEVKDPARTVPRATLIGVVLTGLIYFGISAAFALYMPADAAAKSPAPVAAFLGSHFGAGVAGVVALFAAISAFGALNGWVLVQGEMPCAMAKGGVFPRWFAAETAQRTPLRGHLLSSALLTVVVLMNFQKGMADLFSFIASVSLAAGLLAYLMSALAALRLVPGDLKLASAAVIAALFTLWAEWGLGGEAVAYGAVLVALGLPVYLGVRRG
jgi:APA family basic amino acid/polyamine antiporter